MICACYCKIFALYSLIESRGRKLYRIIGIGIGYLDCINSSICVMAEAIVYKPLILFGGQPKGAG